MSDPIPTPSSSPRAAPPRRRWLAGVALAAAFVAGGVTLPVVVASAQDAAMGSMMSGHGRDHAAMHAMVMAHVSKMLDEVGASADQKSKIEAILHDGFKPMMTLHGDMAETHRALHDLLIAPTIDRRALEQLRAAEIAKLDQASRGMTQSLADAAEVLRPDQRAKLASLIAARHAPS